MLKAMKRRLMVCTFALCVSLPMVGQAQEADELTVIYQNLLKACPKQWEGLFSDIELNPNVLDIWQGDLTDKAQFVQYADEYLRDEDDALLIDNYSDVVTLMTECGAQRVNYYKTIRQQIGARVGHLVSGLTGQTAFSRNSLTSGVDYTDWIEGSTTVEPEVPIEIVNLAIGRGTTQSGTSSDELSDTETERTEDEYADLAEGQGYAVKAVDNNTDGNFVNGSVTHTGFQDQPYWEVDLEVMSKIESIIIHNRTDCCQERLTNFSILLSTRPIDARTLNEAKALAGVTEVFAGQSILYDVYSRTFTLPADSKARYVRIQLTDNNTVLSLAEVQVMGYQIEKDL